MSVCEEFYVPQYLEKFRCKGPQCRNSCCHGFQVNITLKDYYKLIGLTCSRPLRNRLDSALKVLDHPTRERYAAINPNWDGDCPMHGEDGFCLLQKKHGEASLPIVCRYFPRGLKIAFVPECSCSNACERVLELLWEQDTPLRFVLQPLSFDLPPLPKPSENPAAPYYFDTRRLVFETLQERRFSLPQRIFLLGEQLQALEAQIKRHDTAALRDAVAQARQTAMAPPQIQPLASEAYQVLLKILDWCKEEYPDLTGFVSQAQEHLDPHTAASLETARAGVLQALPRLPLFLEQVLSNHIFYSGFPFSDRRETFHEGYLAFCVLYGLLDVLLCGALCEKSRESDLIDLCSAFFRMVEHVNFDQNMLVLLHNAGFLSCPGNAFLGISQ